MNGIFSYKLVFTVRKKKNCMWKRIDKELQQVASLIILNISKEKKIKQLISSFSSINIKLYSK